MQEITLLKISLISSIIGTIILIILSSTLEPKLIKIKNIKDLDLYKKIKIQGNITSIKNYNDFNILEINDNSGKINIIANGKLNLTKNQAITVTGKITEYKDELQLQAEKILY